MDLPPSGVDFYIHRSGRTGRKGQPGRAILVYSESHSSRFGGMGAHDFFKQVSMCVRVCTSQFSFDNYSCMKVCVCVCVCE